MLAKIDFITKILASLRGLFNKDRLINLAWELIFINVLSSNNTVVNSLTLIEFSTNNNRIQIVFKCRKENLLRWTIFYYKSNLTDAPTESSHRKLVLRPQI